MKAPVVVAASLSALVLAAGSVGFVLLRAREGQGREGSNSHVALEALTSRLEALEKKLEEVPRLRDEIASLRRQGSSAPVASSANVPSETGATGKVPGKTGSASSAEAVEGDAPPGKLELWLQSQGMDEDFDTLVARSYERARNDRRKRESEEAQRQAEERKLLSQGPYGDHNYRINSLARKLDLTERQKGSLHQLLTGQEQRLKAALAQLGTPEPNAASPEEMGRHLKQITTTSQQIAGETEALFRNSLGVAQREAFDALDEGERGFTQDHFVKEGMVIEAAPAVLGAARAAFKFVEAGQAVQIEIPQAPPEPKQ